MSREGRWRLLASGLRGVGVIVAVAGVTWGAWQVTDALQEDSRKMPAAAKTVAVKTLELITDAAGVLDSTWLRQALALPKGVSLMELDLAQLRGRLLASGQVSTASLTRKFPDTLTARLTERSPILRVKAQLGGGEPRILLVARDGVVFEGVGFDADRLAELPWLDGVKLVRQGGKIRPIAGIQPAADLLARARLEAEHLYVTWQVVSLAHLESDQEIEVRTTGGTVVVFAAGADYFRQLAKLDYQWEKLAHLPVPPSRIDLSLGREVPVAFAPPPAGPLVPGAAVTPAFSVLPPAPSKSKREL